MFACGIQNTRNIHLWNLESWALGSGSTAQEIRNPAKDWNLESKFQWQRIQYLESIIHGVESRIQDGLGFPYMGRSNLWKNWEFNSMDLYHEFLKYLVAQDNNNINHNKKQ